jgi:hypothetical protein
MTVICMFFGNRADGRMSGTWSPYQYEGINLEAAVASCSQSRPGGRVYNDFAKYKPLEMRLIVVVWIQQVRGYLVDLGGFVCEFVEIDIGSIRVIMIHSFHVSWLATLLTIIMLRSVRTSNQGLN